MHKGNLINKRTDIGNKCRHIVETENGSTASKRGRWLQSATSTNCPASMNYTWHLAHCYTLHRDTRKKETLQSDEFFGANRMILQVSSILLFYTKPQLSYSEVSSKIFNKYIHTQTDIQSKNWGKLFFTLKFIINTLSFSDIFESEKAVSKKPNIDI